MNKTIKKMMFWYWDVNEKMFFYLRISYWLMHHFHAKKSYHSTPSPFSSNILKQLIWHCFFLTVYEENSYKNRFKHRRGFPPVPQSFILENLEGESREWEDRSWKTEPLVKRALNSFHVLRIRKIKSLQHL